MTASATNPVARTSLGGPSLNQSTTFRDSEVSNNTSSHLNPAFQLCLRAFKYVAIDMLPRNPVCIVLLGVLNFLV